MSPSGLALVAVAALACGAINSVAGGGSLLLFPALIAGGLGRLSANVTNSIITWPGYLGGVIGFDIRRPALKFPGIGRLGISQA